MGSLLSLSLSQKKRSAHTEKTGKTPAKKNMHKFGFRTFYRSVLRQYSTDSKLPIPLTRHQDEGYAICGCESLNEQITRSPILSLQRAYVALRNQMEHGGPEQVLFHHQKRERYLRSYHLLKRRNAHIMEQAKISARKYEQRKERTVLEGVPYIRLFSDDDPSTTIPRRASPRFRNTSGAICLGKAECSVLNFDDHTSFQGKGAAAAVAAGVGSFAYTEINDIPFLLRSARMNSIIGMYLHHHKSNNSFTGILTTSLWNARQVLDTVISLSSPAASSSRSSSPSSSTDQILTVGYFDPVLDHGDPEVSAVMESVYTKLRQSDKLQSQKGLKLQFKRIDQPSFPSSYFWLCSLFKYEKVDIIIASNIIEPFSLRSVDLKVLPACIDVPIGKTSKGKAVGLNLISNSSVHYQDLLRVGEIVDACHVFPDPDPVSFGDLKYRFPDLPKS